MFKQNIKYIIKDFDLYLRHTDLDKILRILIKNHKANNIDYIQYAHILNIMQN